MNKPILKLSIGEKTVISFLVIPAIPAAIFSAYSLTEYRMSMLSTGVFFVFAYLFASAHGFLLGIPAFLLGKRLNVIHWWTCILGAFLIGGLPIGFWRGGAESITGGLFGASAGFTFWLLWQFWIHSDQ